MSLPRSLVRYAILLPKFFNDGSPVPEELFLETVRELLVQFNGISIDSAEVIGIWVHEGQRYEDRHRRLQLTVPDEPQNEQFMRSFKEVLKSRFDQVDIWIEMHAIQVL